MLKNSKKSFLSTLISYICAHFILFYLSKSIFYSPNRNLNSLFLWSFLTNALSPGRKASLTFWFSDSYYSCRLHTFWCWFMSFICLMSPFLQHYLYSLQGADSEPLGKPDMVSMGKYTCHKKNPEGKNFYVLLKTSFHFDFYSSGKIINIANQVKFSLLFAYGLGHGIR